MAITRGYCTLTEFQKRTGLTSTQLTAKTALIEREIERNSRRIDQETNSIFYTRTLTDSKVRFDFPANSDGLVMSEDAYYISFPAPILTITSITNNDEALTDGEDYFIEGNLLFSDGIFTTNRKNGVIITGTCGYSATPDDINEACLAMTEVSTGLGTITMIDANGDKTDITRDVMPDWVSDILNQRVRMDGVG